MKLESTKDKALKLLRANGGGSLFATSDGQIFHEQNFAHSHSFNLKDKTKYIFSTESLDNFKRLLFKGSGWQFIELPNETDKSKLDDMTIKELKSIAKKNNIEVKGKRDAILETLKNNL